MLAADAGANLSELMDRMGHSTSRAAMVYLHGSNERQQAIADDLSRQAGSGAAGPVHGEAIGHATGTATAEGLVSCRSAAGRNTF
jgi:hypothetical protein